MKQRTGFRAWFYFRQGWSTYFAFIFAAVNTLTVTYYLAIEKAPILQGIFPSFLIYVVVLTSIGIPILVIIGWLHYRRTAAYGSEAEVQLESNPYMYKAMPGWQKEVIFPFYNKMIDIMLKNAKNEKLTEKDIQEMIELQKKFNDLNQGKMIGSPRKIDDTKTNKNNSI